MTVFLKPLGDDLTSLNTDGLTLQIEGEYILVKAQLIIGGGGGAGGVPDHDSQRKKTPFHISRGK